MHLWTKFTIIENFKFLENNLFIDSFSLLSLILIFAYVKKTPKTIALIRFVFVLIKFRVK